MRLTISAGCRAAVLLPLCLMPAACDRHVAASRPEPLLSPLAQLGKRLFYEPALSASGKQSCASCHDPAHAFGPPDGRPAQFGGPDLSLQGARATPSLRYVNLTPGFSIGPEAEGEAGEMTEGRGSRNPGLVASVKPAVAKSAAVMTGSLALVAQGGLFWDGRARTLQEQALGPLLNPVEMANENPEVLAEKVRQLPYAAEFSRLVDPHILDDKRRLPSYAAFAIARYEMEDPAFHPYDSKYDVYLQGRARLTPQELRGLKVFEDPLKGNCAACHPDKIRPDGRLPAFTDYEYEALAAPRNNALAVNADPEFVDLGICGPARRDIYARQASNCGLFKTPSLRNAAVRQVFFHNGVFHSLEDVLHFYAERETHPEKFYARKPDGGVNKYDDLPAVYHGNVDTIDAPFNRHPGDKPALTDDEIRDVIAFLGTLTDGYRP